MPGAHGTEVVDAQRRLRRLRTAATDVLQALAVLQRTQDGDVWGRYAVGPTEQVDAAELAGFVGSAQQEYPGCPLEVIVVARVGGQNPEAQGARGGHYAQGDRR